MTDNLWNLDEVTRTDMRLVLATLKEHSGYALIDCPVFKPFGASLDLNGAVRVTVAQLDGQPDLLEYRNVLIRGFRNQAARGEIRAAGYAELGRFPEGAGEVDTVLIRIECRDGVSSLVSVPYSVEGPDKVSFGESVIMRAEPWLWVELDHAARAEPALQ